MTRQATTRRQKSDPLMRLITIANVGAVVSLIIAFGLTSLAKPDIETFFDRFYDLNLYKSPYWDTTLMNYIGIMLLVCCAISLFGIYVNSKRLKRKGDYIRATQVVSLVVALLGLVLYASHMLGS